MPGYMKRLLPWNWLKGRSADAKDDRKGSSVAPGTKRKRAEEDADDFAKRPRLSEEKLQQVARTGATKDTASGARFWNHDNYEAWRHQSGRIPHLSSSVDEHASTSADIAAQAQLQTEASQDHNFTRPTKLPILPKQIMGPPPKPTVRRGAMRTPIMPDVPPSIEEDEIGDASSHSIAPSAASRRRADQPDDFDLELARRHAAAVTIPSDSGIWAVSEKQLFYHLALRGFEPLLPQNWMVDFKTLPLSLFANENTNPPLIQVQQGTTFRALHALRELIETGKLARDKTISSPASAAAKRIEKSVKDYFSWALTDSNFNISSDNYIPNHMIFTRRKGQSTADAIQFLNIKLRKLAARHRERLGIVSSIENGAYKSDPDAPGELKDSTTRVYDDSHPSEPPVLYGIFIVSTILVIFTLNGLNSLSSADDIDNDNAGLRYLAKFDFSDASHDVWNAFAVAITAVEARNALEKYGFDKTIKREEGVHIKQEGEDSIPNPRKGKKVVNSGWFSWGVEREDTTIVVDDDPDR